MISKTLERVIYDPERAKIKGYDMALAEISFLEDRYKSDRAGTILRIYMYGFVRGKRAAEAGRSKKK